MSEKRFELILIKYNDENDVDESWWAIKDNETDKTMQDVETVELLNELNNENEVVDLLNRQTRIIKGQDLEIQRLQNLAMAMSGVLREEFGVYDVFDRTKDKKI